MITIFEYVCNSNPEDSRRLIRTITPFNPKDGKEALACMKKIMHDGSDNLKRMLLAGIADIHPDKELLDMLQNIDDPMGNEQSAETFGVKTNAIKATGDCGCGGHEKLLPAAGSDLPALSVQDPTIAELAAFKTKMETKSIVNDVLWKTGIIVSIVIICAIIMVSRRRSAATVPEIPGV